MALRYSFARSGLADTLEKAIANVLAKGLRTRDIAGDGATVVGTTDMGRAIREEFAALVG
jgi:3-isopropylmalate dehydrogenase